MSTAATHASVLGTPRARLTAGALGDVDVAELVAVIDSVAARASALDRDEADLREDIAAGEQDSTCPAVQSEKLAGALRGVGYDVDLTELAGADHLAPVFHEERDGQRHPASDDAPGRQTVQVIADAIAAAQS